MRTDVDIPQLYLRRPINVWVEDEFSRVYLRELWNDPLIDLHVAGDSPGVGAATANAEREEYPAVYGVVDKDFGSSNRGRWFNPGSTSRLFRLPAHELENYLLDPRALHGAGVDQASVGTAEIDQLLTQRAAELLWWVACGATMADLSRRVTRGFPHAPPKPPPQTANHVSTLEHAREHICGSEWFERLATRTEPFDEPAEIEALLAAAQQRLDGCLANGRWRTEFPGKELLDHLANRIWRTPAANKTERNAGIAYTVAAWQRNNAVPTDLVALHNVIRQRYQSALSQRT